MKTRICLAVLFLAMSLPLFSQKEKNNIYIFDCTRSMKEQGLWEPAQKTLHETVSNQVRIPSSQFWIIPFGDKPYEIISFDSRGYNQTKKERIEKCFDRYEGEAKYTHISDALSLGFSKCDPRKENRIYLLTDGMPNGGDNSAKVAETINKWCGGRHNGRLFYVALKKGIVNDEIRRAIEACPDAYIVECSDNVIPQVADIKSIRITTDIEKLDQIHELSFSIPIDFPLLVNCDDPVFAVTVDGNKAVDGKIPVRISAKNGQDTEGVARLLSEKGEGRIYDFTFTLVSGNRNYFIANPDVEVQMANYIQSCLTIAKEMDEVDAGTCSRHSAFLWSPASAEAEISVDLAPAFSHVSDLDARYVMRLTPGDGEPRDFKIYYNGNEVGTDGLIHLTPGNPAKIRIVFDKDAITGKRYFKLIPVDSRGVDIVNNTPCRDFKGFSIRTQYKEVWNPLKKALTWIAAGIVALLLLWFLLLRRILFPVIRASRIEITGPGRYYVSKRIRGKRKVILTSLGKKQNVFDRIFTGEILYIRDGCLTPDIEITPGGRKKVRLRSSSTGPEGWDFVPSSTIAPYETVTMMRRSGAEKATVQVQ